MQSCIKALLSHSFVDRLNRPSGRIRRNLAKASRRMGRLILPAFSIMLSVWPVSGQTNAVPGSDPQATVLASKAVAALVGSQVIKDVTLTGNVTRYVGNTENGTVTLKALGSGESRIDFDLSEGIRTEIRDSATGTTLGKWINPNGKSGMIASHNTLTDAAWFFPALGSLSANPGTSLSYVDHETWKGVQVEHLRSCISLTGQASVAQLLQLSTMDFYLDSATMLPVSLTFNTHPDNDEQENILIEVDFSNYQTVSGAAVPMHIQRLQNGHLLEDIVISNVEFNTGLPISMFALN
jgi:hypothetical protein